MRSQSAIVSGGAVRLGQHIALYLAKQGYAIALHYCHSQAAAQSTCQEIRALGVPCEVFAADFSSFAQENSDEFFHFLEKINQKLPPAHLLINSASVYKAATISETTPSEWNNHFAVNVRAPFFLTQAFATQKHWQEEGEGNIINILDNKIAFSQYHYAAYVLSKKSLAELTILAATEFAPKIRVNGIAPGIILPRPSRKEKYLNWRLGGVPLKKQGSVENILQAVDYLLQNDFLTGQILTVDGGENQGFAGRNFVEYEDGLS